MNFQYRRLPSSIFLVFFIALSIAVSAQVNKSKLRVLYVGGSTNYTGLDYSTKTKETIEADARKRMASFEGMLKKYFDQVAVVHAKDYRVELSADYDVTVMDGVSGSKQYTTDFDPQKDRLLAEQVNVLPDDFSYPMLFIGEASFKLGSKIGAKFDWYCLCLEDDAYNRKTSHEIFKGPFPAKISTTKKPLPYSAASANYREDKLFPSQVDMWKVQDVSLEERRNNSYRRIGLVVHPGGFEDSPESEIISGGSSAKEANAVAIGRHGNFLHWGFAASPEHLTEEAKTVLANAIAYISRFKGKGVIARKFADRIKTTYDITGMRDAATERGRMTNNNYFKETALAMVGYKKELEAKKAKGEQLSESDEAILKDNANTTYQEKDLGSYLRIFARELFPRFGTDLKAYRKYYDENMGYFYSDSKGMVTIDEDLKSLGIKHNDIKLLDAAIGMLERGQDTEKAQRILNRYTLASFTTPGEWRKWYNENKSRLFFTESGGYYFLVNTYDKKVEGNDYRKKQKQLAYSAITPGATSDEHPVSVAVGSTSLANGNKEIIVRVKIHPSYHIYSYVSEKDPFIKTEVKITPPQGYKAVGGLKAPAAVLYNPNGTSVYKEEAIYVQEVQGSGAAEAICEISYQCCNDDICYPPEELQFKVKL